MQGVALPVDLLDFVHEVCEFLWFVAGGSGLSLGVELVDAELELDTTVSRLTAEVECG